MLQPGQTVRTIRDGQVFTYQVVQDQNGKVVVVDPNAPDQGTYTLDADQVAEDPDNTGGGTSARRPSTPSKPSQPKKPKVPTASYGPASGGGGSKPATRSALSGESVMSYSSRILRGMRRLPK